jgi:SWI/SNF-related matrix-associated actin-dependent regulator 1 of chromatin subfamily A
MVLTYEAATGRFVLRSSYEERFTVKDAGFRWDPTAKRWWTDSKEKAANLIGAADEETKVLLGAYVTAAAASREASRATDAAVNVPAPDGLSYLPFQKAGIAFASSRPGVLIADEMGLGKTIQALGIVNGDESIRRVLVVCPASLKMNWKREAEKWLVRRFVVAIASSDSFALPAASGPVEGVVVIVNYDVLHRHEAAIRAEPWDLLIVDEAHYIKTPTARRTVQVIGTPEKKRAKAGTKTVTAIPAKRRAFLTGTPIVNRPIELWPIVHALDPGSFGSFWAYASRYSNAHNNGWGWDFSGAANLDELQDRLRSSIMVRRLKKDVLTELPAKRRQVIEIAANGNAGIVSKETAAWEAVQESLAALRAAVEMAKTSEDPAEYRAAVEALRAGEQAAFNEISRLRHDTAVAKIPMVIEHLSTIVEEGDAKVVVFAHHHDVVRALAGAFPTSSVVLTGETPMIERQAAVDRFQTDPTCTVFIGSITAAGVGLTLTASSHVVFAELDWVPGNLSQAEDRCHRIGQTESVLVQHLVLEGSLDATMAKTIVRKQAVIEAALDATHPEREAMVLESSEPVVEERREAASRTTKYEAVTKEAETITERAVAAVLDALRRVSGLCDMAQRLDGQGFNKIDARIGHDLASRSTLTKRQAVLGRKIVRKYRKQFPAELLDAMAE